MSSLSIVKDATSSSSCSTGKQVHLAPASANGVQATQFRGRAAIVTLGCAKNQVDSEVMLGVLGNAGYEIVNDVSRADVAVVNTCGFLEAAVQEGVDTILDLSELKKEGSLKQLVVAGCMVSRYKGDLQESLPEVDAFLSTDELLHVSDAVEGNFQSILHKGARPHFLYDESMPRILGDRNWLSYVKVAEGCDRPCTFCIIPQIRGAMRSRPIESIVQEVQALARGGVQEINLVAQDLTSFGKDHKQGGLQELLKALQDDGSVPWIRTLYAYPIGTDEALLRTMVESSRICNYFDIPLQHASESMLKRMQRPVGRFAARPMTEFIRKIAPELAIRTTFIVGFPGETEEDVRALEQLVSEGHFSSVGVFTYSPERGTPAADMDGQIDNEEKELRRQRIMLAQQGVIDERLHHYVGRTIPVLVEGAHEDTDLLLSGRAEFQAPEVDGIVVVNDFTKPDEIYDYTGTFQHVTITEIAGYDLVGTLINS